MESIRLRPHLIGPSRLEAIPGGWRLHIGSSAGYADAQLDSTHGLGRAGLPCRPPAHLALEARASAASPGGTLGFGFWNDPFPSWAGEAGARRLLPSSPQATWFFHASPPSDLPFSRDGAGSGWAGSVLAGPRLPAVVFTALAAGAAGAMMVPALRSIVLRAYWRWTQGAQSAPLAGLDGWHAYDIDWGTRVARLSVDGRTVLEAPSPPGPMGIVIWIDNQWAAFSRSAGLRFGVLPSLPPAWLDVRAIRADGNPVSLDRQP